MKRAALLLALTGCGGGGAVKADPAPAPVDPPAAPASAPASAGVAAWDCTGNIVPPAGYITATGLAAAGPDGLASAQRAALENLRGKVCGGSACGALASELKVWRTGASASQACAMATVNRKAVDAWRAGNDTSSLDDQLAAAARELTAGIKRKQPNIFVARIVDGGASGGPRARWLLPRLRRAFTAAGAVPVSWEGWSGKDIPKGVDGVVEASLTARVEKGEPVLELAVEMMHRAGAATGRRAAGSILFPAAVAPAGGPALPPLPSDPGLVLRFESGEGGVLCAGARTRLVLSSDQAAHVRVFSLYGDGEALLIHPSAPGDDAIGAGKTITIGGSEGFEALPVPGADVERVLVVAAANEAGLGDLAGYRTTCRLPAGVAGRLHRFEGLPPKSRASADGYRIVEGDGCPSLDPAARDRIRAALAEVPTCL
ncbi:MAG: hypothetical protein H6706_01145 [Myxococcales bacterium]|nr:hypothetical protein [Myxococcales bacterium]